MSNQIPQIFKTNDYAIFKLAEFNRSIKDITVKKLKKECAIENNFKYFPILVDENMTVIDGQHRLVACSELNLPVYYMIKNSKVKPRDVRTVNRAGSKHTIVDIFNMECKTGNLYALKIKELNTETRELINISALIALCLGTTSGGQVRDRLENGNYEILDFPKKKLIAKMLIELSGDKRVSITLYNVITSMVKVNNLNTVSFISDLIYKNLTLNSKMSKIMIVNKILETYNHRKRKENKISYS